MKDKRQYIFSIMKLFYVCVVLFALLTTATYTWWSFQKTATVSGMALYVNAPTGLQITLEEDPDEDDWGQQVDFEEFIEDNPGILRPATWSDENEAFYAANYSLDGRITDFGLELDDDEHANREDSDGYYTKLTLYARTQADVDVSLSEAVEVSDGMDGAGTYLVGTPIWDEGIVAHTDGGMGAQYAMRVGFRIEIFDEDGDTEDELFYIYEPNSDIHFDESLDGDYVDTPSIDGDETLVDEDYLIIQEASTWDEDDPVVNDIVIYDMGEFTTETTLFTLEMGQTATIDIYIWMEGQDIDCINQLGAGAEIFANFQFDAQASESQTGLESLY